MHISLHHTNARTRTRARAQTHTAGQQLRTSGVSSADAVGVRRKEQGEEIAQVPGAPTTALADGVRASNECLQGLSMINKQEAAAWAEAPCCYHRIRCGGQREEGREGEGQKRGRERESRKGGGGER